MIAFSGCTTALRKLMHDNPTYLVETRLMLGLAFATSVYGTHMVGALRAKRSKPGGSGNTG